jgi:hypothetical protein
MIDETIGLSLIEVVIVCDSSVFLGSGWGAALVFL